MSFTLDYDEPVGSVVQRLKSEHAELEPKLDRVLRESKSGDLKAAISLLNSMRDQMLRHAVEEEARLMRVIMLEAGTESQPSVSIMRWHRELANFLKYRLPKLQTLSDDAGRREVQIFINDLKKHHEEEERVVLPLVLRVQKEAEGQARKGTQLEVPKSVEEEHEELHRALSTLTRRPGEVGEVAKTVADRLHSHFVKEEEYALRPLSLLPKLKDGKVDDALRQAIPMTDTLEMNLGQMLEEHAEIRAALRELEEAGKKAKDPQAVEFSRKLALHALAEEEVYYPAAILVGRYLRLRLRTS